MEKICSTCGHCGSGDTAGSFWIELLLWLCFGLPGLIYTIWRLTTRGRSCAKCDSATLIPADTPRGRELLAQYTKGPSPETQAATARKIAASQPTQTPGIKVWK